jgi:hypothetical protein
MRLIRTFLSLLAFVSTAVEGRSATGQRVLVIVEHAINRADYSQFWDSLQGELSSSRDDTSTMHRLLVHMLINIIRAFG